MAQHEQSHIGYSFEQEAERRPQIVTTFDYGETMDRLMEQAALLALLRDRKSGWSLVSRSEAAR